MVKQRAINQSNKRLQQLRIIKKSKKLILSFTMLHPTQMRFRNLQKLEKNTFSYRPYPKDCKFSNCNWLNNIVPTMFSNDNNTMFYCNGSLDCSPNSWGMTSMNLPSGEPDKIQEKILEYLGEQIK